ncbi:MAG: WG repeat-containing protein [Lachnospiraceae bacterium]|nr:WG repeat-containing protein [Lachnospiraceae bacterium]
MCCKFQKVFISCVLAAVVITLSGCAGTAKETSGISNVSAESISAVTHSVNAEDLKAKKAWLRFTDENGLIGYLDYETGEVEIEPQFTYASAYDRYYILVGDDTGKWFISGEDGEQISDVYEDAQDFSIQNVYAAVKINGKWGIVNSDFQIVLEPEFDFVDGIDDIYGIAVGMREGVACIIYLRDLETQSLASYLPLEGYTYIEPFYLDAVAVVTNEDGLQGIVSYYGDIVVEAKYECICDMWRRNSDYYVFYFLVENTDGDCIIVYLNQLSGETEEIIVEDDTISELLDLLEQSQ